MNIRIVKFNPKTFEIVYRDYAGVLRSCAVPKDVRQTSESIQLWLNSISPGASSPVPIPHVLITDPLPNVRTSKKERVVIISLLILELITIMWFKRHSL